VVERGIRWMKECDKIKIRKLREMIAAEFGNKFEDEFQYKRTNRIKDKYKDPHFWNEESSKSLSKISSRYGRKITKCPVYVDKNLNILH
jgi:abortive infection bacteriophage resistance protein